jgi:hypothetical protein
LVFSEIDFEVDNETKCCFFVLNDGGWVEPKVLLRGRIYGIFKNLFKISFSGRKIIWMGEFFAGEKSPSWFASQSCRKVYPQGNFWFWSLIFRSDDARKPLCHMGLASCHDFADIGCKILGNEKVRLKNSSDAIVFLKILHSIEISDRTTRKVGNRVWCLQFVCKPTQIDVQR